MTRLSVEYSGEADTPDDGEDDERENKVEQGAEGGDHDPPPWGGREERALHLLGLRRGRGLPSPAGYPGHQLAFHLAVAANGKPGDLVHGPPALESHQAGSPAEGEGFNFHAVHLCSDEVPQLVDEDHEAETDDAEEKRDYHADPFIVLKAPPPRPLMTAARQGRRTSRKAVPSGASNPPSRACLRGPE